MTIAKHGFSIGLERIDDDYFIILKAMGKLTHNDYKKITPLLDSALESVQESKFRVLFDATQFEGWELRAAWDDFKLGMKHQDKFEKIAIIGNKDWLEKAAKIGSWFIAGEVKFFENQDDATAYLQEA